jgi:hypothetical protein
MGFKSLLIVFIVIAAWPSFADSKLRYKSFPLISARDSVRKNEPARIVFGKQVLNPLTHSSSGTVKAWGIEQVYVSRDLKKRVLVKYNVDINSEKIVGGWTRLSKGRHVLHFKTGSSLSAVMVQGLNNVEMMEVQKQLSRRAPVGWNHLFPKAAADEAVTGVDAMGNISYAPSQNTSYEPGADVMARVGNIASCVGQEAWEAAKANAANLWQGDSKSTMQERVQLVHSTSPSMLLLRSAAYLSGKSPAEVWDDVSGRVQHTFNAMAKISEEIGSAISEFPQMPPDVKDRIVCDAIAYLAPQGVLDIAATAITVGAAGAAAAIRLANLVKTYFGRLRPLIPRLLAIMRLDGVSSAHKLEQIDDLFDGRTPSYSTVDTAATGATKGNTSVVATPEGTSMSGVPGSTASVAAVATERVTDAVSVLWYPSKVHAELRIGDRMYNTIGRSWVGRPSEMAQAQAGRSYEAAAQHARTSGAPFYEFHLSVTRTELEELERLAQSTTRTGPRTCIGGACYLVRQATGDSPVMTGINQSPALSAAYMAAAKQLGSNRIHSIEYVGRERARALLSPGFALEASGTATFVGMSVIIITIWVGDQLEYRYVPVEQAGNP